MVYMRPGFNRTIALPFVASDVHRLAEYFEGNLESAYRFVRSVWLPDAIKTLHALAGAIHTHAERDVVFQCDHLTEGARTVGARQLIDIARSIETAFLDGRDDVALRAIDDSLDRLHSTTAWLDRRASRKRSATARRTSTDVGRIAVAAKPPTPAYC